MFLLATEAFELYAAYKEAKAVAKTVQAAAKTAKLLLVAANGEYDWALMARKLRSLEQKLESLKTFKPETIGHPECALVAPAPSVRAVVPISMNLHTACALLGPRQGQNQEAKPNHRMGPSTCAVGQCQPSRRPSRFSGRGSPRRIKRDARPLSKPSQRVSA